MHVDGCVVPISGQNYEGANFCKRHNMLSIYGLTLPSSALLYKGCFVLFHE